ncbi:MAG TPA: hypothetical protein VIY52_32015 [Streptosporangiaceae bacterium]
MPDGRSLETLTAEDFRGQQGTRFQLTGGAPDGRSLISFEAELVDVTEHAGNVRGTFRVPFSVLFHGPLDPIAPQGTYRVAHEQLGMLELFIAPVGPGDPSAPGQAPTAMRYEAVFG